MTTPTSRARQGSMRAALLASLLLTGNALLTTSATGQCTLDWQPGPDSNGPQGIVSATVRTPNGDLIAGGNFSIAGGEIVNNVARFDGSRWRAMSSGITGNVRSAVVMPNGDVVVGGAMTAAGGTPVTNIARWDGSSWSNLGAGVAAFVEHLVVLPNGDIVASSTITITGGPPMRWNGSNWSALGSTNLGYIHALTVQPNGTLIAAGDAWTGIPDIVSWNGTAWVGLPGLVTSSLTSVNECLALSNGNLFITANQVSGVTNGLAIWDGAQLTPITAPPMSVFEVTEAANGDLLVFASLTASAQQEIMRFNGSTWTTLGGTPPEFVTDIIEDPSGNVIAAGRPDDEGQVAAVARYQAGQWLSLGPPTPADVSAVQRLPNGDVIVAGKFTSIGGIPAANIARYDGSSYSPLGQGVDGHVTCLALANDGSLLVGGEFSLAGGVAAQNIARWNGSSWTTLGTGVPIPAEDLAQTGTGEILVVGDANLGDFHVFDGMVWNTVAPPPGVTHQLLTKPDGSVVTIGSYVTVTAGLTIRSAYQYGAGIFTPVPGATGGTGACGTISPSGDLVIASGNSSISGIYTITSQGAQLLIPMTWTALPYVMEFLPDGDLCIGGSLDSTSPYNGVGIRRYTGGGWQLVDGGMTGTRIDDLTFSHGELIVVGEFLTAGGHVSMNLARAVSNCPASVVTVGAGCTGSAGSMQLTTASQPWIGSELAATASGFAPQSLGLNVIGLIAPAIALPLSPTGCTLQLQPIQADLLVPSSGTAQTSMQLPNDTSLVGQVFRTQVVAIELSSGGSLQQLVSTNALQMTIGAF